MKVLTQSQLDELELIKNLLNNATFIKSQLNSNTQMDLFYKEAAVQKIFEFARHKEAING